MARPLSAKAPPMDWDGVRVFLAVARHGSLRAAGRALRLSQPTIARRLAGFEETFGGPTLFDRLPEGAHLNAAGERLLPAAESVEQAVLTLERRRAAASPVLSGTVRVSTGECAAGFLSRCLAEAKTELPSGITLELVQTLEPPSLARREADLALLHDRPDGGNYYAAKLGTFAVAVYRRRGESTDDWVAYNEGQTHDPARWVERQIEQKKGGVVLRSVSLLMQAEAIRAGAGRGVLPCYVGDAHRELERLGAPIAELAAGYWVVVHRDLRRAPVVRAAIDWVKQVFVERRSVIAGRAR